MTTTNETEMVDVIEEQAATIAELQRHADADHQLLQSILLENETFSRDLGERDATIARLRALVEQAIGALRQARFTELADELRAALAEQPSPSEAES